MSTLVNTALAAKIGQTTSFVICLNLPLPKEYKNLVLCLLDASHFS
jgi:hypothetical protein